MNKQKTEVGLEPKVEFVGSKSQSSFASKGRLVGGELFVVQVLHCLVCLIFKVDTSHIVELTCWTNLSVG